MRWVFAVTLMLALNACSSMSTEECQTADWSAIGYEDGAQGKAAEYFGTRRKACAEHGIAADFRGYMAGRAEGVAHYCRPQNGYNVGASGRQYNGICPPELEAGFIEAHADGYGLYQRRAEMNRARQRLNQARQRADKLEYMLAERTASLISPAVPPMRRAQIAIEIKQLTEEKIEVETSIPELEREYSAAERELRAYSQSIAYRRSK